MSTVKLLALIDHYAEHRKSWSPWSVTDLSWHKLCIFLNYESGINVWLYLIIKFETWKSTDSGWSLSQVGTRLVVICHRSEQGTRSWVWLVPYSSCWLLLVNSLWTISNISVGKRRWFWLATTQCMGSATGCDWSEICAGDKLLALGRQEAHGGVSVKLLWQT